MIMGIEPGIRLVPCEYESMIYFATISEEVDGPVVEVYFLLMFQYVVRLIPWTKFTITLVWSGVNEP